jgi:hypothetical protein
VVRDQVLQQSLNEYRKYLEANKASLLHHPRFPTYLDDLARYLSMPAHEDRISLWPCLDKGVPETPLDKYYFYQDTWAAGKIITIRSECVVDVGPTFLLVGIISQFVPTISVDVRPLPVSLPGLTCKRASVTDLPFWDGTVELLSCKCVIEHVGLGRYGDELDTQGSIKAFKEVSRVFGRGPFSVRCSTEPYTRAIPERP